MFPHPFEHASIAHEIWDQKYRLKAADGTAVDQTVDDTWWRVARAAAQAETGGKRARERWAGRFHAIMQDFTFLPAGRIIAGAGSGRRVTLFNCFVMGRIEDDLGSIFDNVREAALTMQQGGGIGHDFSTLRPHGAPVRSTGSDASGPVSFMDVWDSMCRTIMSAGARRGAMMGTMRCDHPDIETFIDAKSDAARLRNFNLSVLVSDAFIAAVKADATWDLVFGGTVHRTVRARALWDRLMRATYAYAEPGVIFIDRINAMNNLAYCEEIYATNPCGEQPLPAHGACLLGSINLARLVERPFTSDAAIDTAGLEERVRLAVRLLDNCIDVSSYPLAAQQREAKAKRRIGLGVTGLADALIFLGQRYGSQAAAATAARLMRQIQNAAYLASAELAAEKGSFPLFDADRFLAAPNVVRLDAGIRDAIARHGIRNGCLTSIAPTGTISLLAGNVSSGVEPVFDFEYQRRLRHPDGSQAEETVQDFAYAQHHRTAAPGAPLPTTFVHMAQLDPQAHLRMQAALQEHVDSSISKTVNCPEGIPFDDFKDIYLEAYDMGLKGCTTFRPNAVTGAVLSSIPATAEAIAPATTAATGDDSNAVVRAAKPVAAGATDGPERGSTGGVFYIAKPLEREPALAGFTYKLRWPGSDHAIYLTINDIERDGRRRPFEIFINSKNLEHYAWTVALTRMISAVFRRGGDVTFVVEELKAIFDPQGGHWIGGRYVPSLLAAIGEVIETHMIRIGFVVPEDAGRGPRPLDMPAMQIATGSELADHGRHRARIDQPGQSGQPADRPGQSGQAGQVGQGEQPGTGIRQAPTPKPDDAFALALARGTSQHGGQRLCPRCTEPGLKREEGCWVCRSCGYSRCG